MGFLSSGEGAEPGSAYDGSFPQDIARIHADLAATSETLRETFQSLRAAVVGLRIDGGEVSQEIARAIAALEEEEAESRDLHVDISSLIFETRRDLAQRNAFPPMHLETMERISRRMQRLVARLHRSEFDPLQRQIERDGRRTAENRKTGARAAAAANKKKFDDEFEALWAKEVEAKTPPKDRVWNIADAWHSREKAEGTKREFDSYLARVRPRVNAKIAETLSDSEKAEER